MMLTLLHLRDADRMVAYTVHEPPHSSEDRLERAETLVFVKDGFNFFAGFLTPIWLLVNRMWVVLLAYLVGIVVVTATMTAVGVSEAWAGLVQLAINIVMGFEADSLRRWSLERKGFATVGTVTGRNSTECERRFFEDWLPRQPVLRVETPSSSVASEGAGENRSQRFGASSGGGFGWWSGAKQADA